MKIRNLVLGLVGVILAAGISIPLGLASEAFSLQHGLLNGTPGLYIAGRLVPSCSDCGFEAMSKQVDIELSIDATLWFLVLSASALLFLWRRKKRQSESRRLNTDAT